MSAPLCFSFPVATHEAGREPLEPENMYIAPIKLNSLDNCVQTLKRLNMIQELQAIEKKFASLQSEEIKSMIQALRGEIVDLIAEDFGI